MNVPLTDSATTAPRPLIGRIVSCFTCVQQMYQAVRPARMALGFTLAVPFIFIANEQASEVLRCLAEGQAEVRVSSALQSVLFFAALTALCLHSWYFTRVLLLFRYPDSPPLTRPAAFAITYVPRVLGWIPAIGLGFAFWAASAAYADGAQARTALKIYAFASWIIGLLLAVFMVLRHIWFQKKHGGHDVTPALESQKDLSATTRRVLMVMATASFCLFAVLFFWPVEASQTVGSGTLLLFAAASWICYGSWIIYLAHKSQTPLVTLIAIAAAIFSLWNDNHSVRTLATPPPAEPASVETAFTAWYSNLQSRFPNEPRHPVFFVAAEGGGIRAAYWTATILGTLQDSNSHFASHLFAISGVSGGSLGAVVFNALLADGLTNSVAQTAQGILGRDFLSPTLAYMLYPDMVQRFLPISFPAWDRAIALERGWEDAWKQVRGNQLFAQEFHKLWRMNPALPNLFLNGTSVQNGKRIITSNLEIDDTFADATDAAGLLDGSLRMSTAAHMSARFTYVSPAGRLRDGGHVVDGGYFENSGAATAADILRTVRQIAPANADMVVILIKNNPVPPESDLDVAGTDDFLSEPTAPLWTLLHTREARGTYSETLVTSDEGVRSYVFVPLASNVPLPLGWQLSRGAAQEMQNQLTNQIREFAGITARLPK